MGGLRGHTAHPKLKECSIHREWRVSPVAMADVEGAMKELGLQVAPRVIGPSHNRGQVTGLPARSQEAAPTAVSGKEA